MSIYRKSGFKKDGNTILQEVASKSQLKEGKDAVRGVLREIYRFGTIGTKSLARKLFLPIPTVAAIRKELEKIGFIERLKKGAILTELGVDFVNLELQINYFQNLLCKECDGTTIELPDDADSIIPKLRDFTDLRPTPQTEIDQAFGKPITALCRALLMLQNDDLEGREVLLLGDDDFTSLAIALLGTLTKITVIDIDKRLLDVISQIAKENNFDIVCIHADLRKPISNKLVGKFDTVLTDPPYTISGLKLFLSRCLQALKPELGRKVYLAYAHRAPNDLLDVQKVIQEHGLVIQQMLPGFNLYEGAEMHGNTTFIAKLLTTDLSKAQIIDEFYEKIYTGEFSPTLRIYKCSKNHEIQIGKNEKIKTIEELKEMGCPVCGSKDKFLRIKREKI